MIQAARHRAQPRALALPALIVISAGVVVLTLMSARSLERDIDPLEQKILAAHRFVYYRVGSGQRPRFQLTGTERQLRIVTHGLLPPGQPYDLERTLIYGLRASLLVEGRELWHHDFYNGSRQSKADWVNGHWLNENSFTPDGEAQAADSRTVVLELPDGIPSGAELALELAPGSETPELLARIYREVRRSPLRQELRWYKLTPELGADLVDGVTYVPWDRLRRSSQLGPIRDAAVRVPAIGREDIDYQTTALYVTGFQVRRREDETTGAIDIRPDRSAAVNVRGPVRLLALVVRAPGDSLDSAADLGLTALGPAPPMSQRVALPARIAMATTTIELPAGVSSLRLSTEHAAGLTVFLAPEDRSGSVALLPTRVGHPLKPTLSFLPAYLIGPDGPPIELAVGRPDDDVGRLVRLDVRLLPVAGEERPTADLGWEILAADGRVLASQRATLEGTMSAFEEIVRPDLPGSATSEPIDVRLIAPPGGRVIRINSSRPAVVRQFSLASTTAADELAEPYRGAEVSGLAWRYAPFSRRSWLSTLPLDQAALADRRVVVRTQVRLEPMAPPPASRPGRALEPARGAERQLVLEALSPTAAGRARAKDVAWTLIDAGDSTEINFGASGAPARLRYASQASPAATLGKMVTVSIDGEALPSVRVIATRGEWRLPRLTGRHRVVVRTEARLRLSLDRAGVGATAYGLQQVYALDGAGLTVSVKKGHAAIDVNVLVYAPPDDGEAPVVRILIDGGNPVRQTGRALTAFTRGDRTLPLPPAERAPVVASPEAGGQRQIARPMVIRLGDDLSPGRHTIEIRRVSGSNLWARFFVAGTDERPRALQWQVSADEGTE